MSSHRLAEQDATSFPNSVAVTALLRQRWLPALNQLATEHANYLRAAQSEGRLTDVPTPIRKVAEQSPAQQQQQKPQPMSDVEDDSKLVIQLKRGTLFKAKRVLNNKAAGSQAAQSAHRSHQLSQSMPQHQPMEMDLHSQPQKQLASALPAHFASVSTLPLGSPRSQLPSPLPSPFGRFTDCSPISIAVPATSPSNFARAISVQLTASANADSNDAFMQLESSSSDSSPSIYDDSAFGCAEPADFDPLSFLSDSSSCYSTNNSSSSDSMPLADWQSCADFNELAPLAECGSLDESMSLF